MGSNVELSITNVPYYDAKVKSACFMALAHNFNPRIELLAHPANAIRQGDLGSRKYSDPGLT